MRQLTLQWRFEVGARFLFQSYHRSIEGLRTVQLNLHHIEDGITVFQTNHNTELLRSGAT